MTDNLHRSISSDNGSSPYISQDVAETHDRATAEVADCPERQPDWALELQALQILDSSDDCIEVLDLEGRILFMNRGGQASLRIQDIAPFLNRSWVNFWPESQQQTAINALAKAAAGEVCSLQGYCPTLNGEPKWWDNKISPILSADGKVERLLCISRDITERKRVEALLQPSHDTFRHLVENSPFGVYVVDGDFRLAFVSAGAQKVFENVRPPIGRDFAEVLRVLWPEPFASEAIALFRHTLKTGEPYHAPSTIERRHDTSEVESYDWKIERITLPDGRFGVVCHFYDLSERHRYEAALRESEAQFRNMANSSPVLIWQTDETGVTFVNRHYLDFFAQTLDGVKGMGWANFLHPDDVAGYIGAYRTAFERQEQYEFQCRFLRHDGEYRWLQNVGKPHYGLDRTFLGFVGCSIDVTDIKTAEEISRRAAKLDAFSLRFTDALRPLSDAIEIQAVASRMLGEHLGANRVAYFEVRGADYVVERDYVNGVAALVGKYAIDSFGEKLLAAYRTGRPVYVSDVKADPNLSDEQQSAYAAIGIGAYIGIPLIKDDEFVAGLAVHAAASRDWTPEEVALAEEVAERTWDAVERARAERALTESRAELERQVQKFDLTLSTITDYVYNFDRAGRFLYANRVLLDLWGLSAEQALGKTMAELQYPADVERQLTDDMQRVFETGETVCSETHYTSPTGIDGYYENFLCPVFAADGTVESAIGSSRNISDRKQAEVALRQSEEQSRHILESITDAFFAVDENWHFTYVNQTACTLVNRTLGDLIGKVFWEEFPGVNDSPFEQMHRRVMRDRVPESLTEFYPDHDRWYEVRSYPAAKGITMYFQDVTEQIQSQEILRDREAQLASEARALVRLNEASQGLWRKLSLSEGLGEMLVATIELLGADMGNIQLLDVDRGVLSIAVQQGFQQDFLDFFREVSTLDDSACGRTLRSGKRTIIEDVETDAPYAPLRPVARAAGYRGVQSTPLMSRDGKPLGMLSTHWRSPHRPSEQDLRRLDLYVRQAADFIEHIRAEAALRQSEERYRTLFESLDEGFCLLEVLFDTDEKPFDYRFVEINKAFEQQSGLVAPVGKTILELVPNLEPQWAECYGQVVKTGVAIRFEADVASMNRVFDVYAFPNGAPGQNLVAVLFTDITKRKRREANLAFLAEIQDDCARLTTARDMMQTIGGKIGAYLNVSVCAFVDVDETEDRAIVPYSWHREDAPNVTGTYRLSEFLSEAFHEEVRAGKIVVVNDTTADERTDAASHVAIDLYSFISVPFLRDGQWKFLLNVADSRPRDWCEDEIELFYELANRIFPRLERARAEVALRESEERYRALTELSPQLVFMSQPNGSITYCNQWGLEFVGRELTELQGDGWAQFIRPDYRDRVFNVWMSATRDVTDYEIEIPFRRTDGVYRWLYTRALPVTDKLGTIIYWIGIALDITDRKQAEATILQREAQFRQLADAIPQQVWITDTRGNTLYVNQQWTDYTGLTLEQTQDIHYATGVIQPDDVEITSELWRTALATGTPYQAEFRLKHHADNTYRWFLSRAIAIRDEQGQIVQWFGTSTDIEEFRRAQAEREQLLQREQIAREQAENANRIKDEFLAVLSHELRSPLNPILGWAKLLQKGKLDATKTAQALATIERNAKLQSELIEDLLDVSRILCGKLSLNVAPVDLASTIRAAMETVRLAAEAKSIEIEASFAPDVGLVSGDSTRLQQVVWNLISNAVKFTPPGGQVNIRLERFDFEAQMTVSDTGQGIAPEFLPFVFDYFRQADGTTTRKFGGLGLGLAIVRHLVELHGGTVSAASPGEGLGATFTVRMPLRSTSTAANEDERSPRQSLDLDGIKILIVDDETDTRELVAFVLEEQGAQVIAATSAHEALLMLPQVKPDILLSDIGMPEMDGYMLIRQVRMLAPELGGRIRAIALTAYAGDTNRQQVLAAGFQKHISKPIEPDALVQAIAHLVYTN